MAYTKAQAREYYFNYTKKGKRKGRKKGRGRKKSSSSISKEQRARCNNECKAIRERIKAEKKEFMRQYREKMKALLSSLRDEMKARLKGMSKGPEKDALKAEYKKRIKAIQELKKQQTEQFNDRFKQYKEKAVNDIRAKYGLKPLKSSSSSQPEQKVELSGEQKSAIDNAVKEAKKK